MEEATKEKIQQEGVWISPTDTSTRYWDDKGEISMIMSPTGFGRQQSQKTPKGIEFIEYEVKEAHLKLETDNQYCTKNIKVLDSRDEAIAQFEEAVLAKDKQATIELLEQNQNLLFIPKEQALLTFDRESDTIVSVKAGADGAVIAQNFEDYQTVLKNVNNSEKLRNYSGEGGVEDTKRLMERHIEIAAALDKDGAVIAGEAVIYKKENHGKTSYQTFGGESEQIISTRRVAKFLGNIEEGKPIERFPSEIIPVSLQDAQETGDKVIAQKAIDRMNANEKYDAKLWQEKNGTKVYNLKSDGLLVTQIKEGEVVTGTHTSNVYSVVRGLESRIDKKELSPVSLEASESNSDAAKRVVGEALQDVKDKFRDNDNILFNPSEFKVFLLDDETGQVMKLELASGFCKQSPNHTTIRDGNDVFNSDVKQLRPIDNFVREDEGYSAQAVKEEVNRIYQENRENLEIMSKIFSGAEISEQERAKFTYDSSKEYFEMITDFMSKARGIEESRQKTVDRGRGNGQQIQ